MFMWIRVQVPVDSTKKFPHFHDNLWECCNVSKNIVNSNTGVLKLVVVKAIFTNLDKKFDRSKNLLRFITFFGYFLCHFISNIGFCEANIFAKIQLFRLFQKMIWLWKYIIDIHTGWGNRIFIPFTTWLKIDYAVHWVQGVKILLTHPVSGSQAFLKDVLMSKYWVQRLRMKGLFLLSQFKPCLNFWLRL